MSYNQLNENYFENIDTNEKAYWLGFLYADGYVSKNKNLIVLNLAKKDEEIIDNFIKCLNICPDKKRNTLKYLKSTDKYYKCIDIKIYNEKIKLDLIKHGCIPLKTTRLTLPILNSDDLYNAFLCGFYDGDGFEKSNIICCGCLSFLQQVKEKYNIPYDIVLKKNPYGQCYVMCIGWELRNTILNSYPNSLKRKRKFSTGANKFLKGNNWNSFRTDVYTIDPNEQNKKYLDIELEQLKKMVETTGLDKISKLYNVCEKTIRRICKLNNIKLPSLDERHIQQYRFNISKEELEQLIQEKSFEEIGRLFNVSGNSIKKRCKSLNIIIPKREPGYWAKKYAENNYHDISSCQ